MSAGNKEKNNDINPPPAVNDYGSAEREGSSLWRAFLPIKL